MRSKPVGAGQAPSQVWLRYDFVTPREIARILNSYERLYRDAGRIALQRGDFPGQRSRRPRPLVSNVRQGSFGIDLLVGNAPEVVQTSADVGGALVFGRIMFGLMLDSCERVGRRIANRAPIEVARAPELDAAASEVPVIASRTDERQLDEHVTRLSRAAYDAAIDIEWDSDYGSVRFRGRDR